MNIPEDLKQRITDAGHRAIEKSHEDDGRIDRTELDRLVLLMVLKMIDEEEIGRMMSDLDLELREKHNIPDEKDTAEWCEENGIDYREELINIYYGK